MVNMWINEKYCFYQFKHFRRYLPTKEKIMTIDFWIYNRIKKSKVYDNNETKAMREKMKILL